MSEGPPPTVTVCIPTYRGAHLLGATLASVLAQTWQDFELLVVDDQSPDDTADCVAAFQDPRIRYHRNPSNLGPEGNWNRCLDLARGRYFKLLPHDDLLAPDCLASQVAVLEADATETIALVFGYRRIIGPDGRALATRGRVLPAAGRIAGPELVRRCIRAGGNLIGEPGNGLMRLALARRLGRYDASLPYVVDIDWWFRALRHGDAYYTARHASSFRISQGSWSVALGRRQYHDFAGLIDRARHDPQMGVSVVDGLCGRWMARLSTQGRALFYRFLLPRA